MVLPVTFGAGFIQGPPHLTWGIAEFITVFCALLFALHILFTQRITTRRDPIAVSTTSFLVVAICSALTVFLLGDGTESRQWSLIYSEDVLIPVLLLGIGGSFFCLLFFNISDTYIPFKLQLSALEPFGQLYTGCSRYAVGVCGFSSAAAPFLLVT